MTTFVFRPLVLALAALSLGLAGCGGPSGPDMAPDEGDMPLQEDAEASLGGGYYGESWPMLGEVAWMAFDSCPQGWMRADGRALPIASYTDLYYVIGTVYGAGESGTFNLPDLRGRMPFGAGEIGEGDSPNTVGDGGPEELGSYRRGYYGVASVQLEARHLPAHTHSLRGATVAPNTASPAGAFLANFGSGAGYTTTSSSLVHMGDETLETAGDGQPIGVTHPHLALTACIAVTGHEPPSANANGETPHLHDREVGNLVMTAGLSCPASFLPADGRTLSLSDDPLAQSLYALVGITYGMGNDPSSFRIPDMRGRSPVGVNAANPATGLPVMSRGMRTGTTLQRLSLLNLPSHTHALNGSSAGDERES